MSVNPDTGEVQQWAIPNPNASSEFFPGRAVNGDASQVVRLPRDSVTANRTISPSWGNYSEPLTGTAYGVNVDFENLHDETRFLLTDLVRELEQALPESIDAVRSHPELLVAFTPEIEAHHLSLKKFLMTHLYKHERVQAMTEKAKQTVTMLFELYLSDAATVPPEFAGQPVDGDDGDRSRRIADYVAGMTDRYALRELKRLAG